MRVKQYGALGRVMELSEALTPEGDNERGAVEDAYARSRATAEGFGRLLAALVAKRVLSLEEAAEVANVWGLEAVDD